VSLALDASPARFLPNPFESPPRRSHAYPRTPGVLIPEELVAVCSQDARLEKVQRHVTADSTPEAARLLGAEVVRVVQRRLRALPRRALDAALPRPERALRSLVLEDRTRKALERAPTSDARDAQAWTVARYLGLRGFGARCLVDLLAACEEARDGAEIVAAPAAPVVHGVAAAIIATATGFVSWWGLANINSLAERVRTLKATPIDAAAARRVLCGVPQLRWLDDDHEWFSLRGETTRFTLLVRKVFGVVGRIARRDLVATLLKGQPPALVPPARVVERYLTEVADCEVEGDHVRPRFPDRATALTVGERMLVDALRAGGGELPLADLRTRLGGDLPEWKVRHLVRSSPLFVRPDPRCVRLIQALYPGP
jgi:hypothetical protein